MTNKADSPWTSHRLRDISYFTYLHGLLTKILNQAERGEKINVIVIHCNYNVDFETLSLQSNEPITWIHVIEKKYWFRFLTPALTTRVNFPHKSSTLLRYPDVIFGPNVKVVTLLYEIPHS